MLKIYVDNQYFNLDVIWVDYIEENGKTVKVPCVDVIIKDVGCEPQIMRHSHRKEFNVNKKFDSPVDWENAFNSHSPYKYTATKEEYFKSIDTLLERDYDIDALASKIVITPAQIFIRVIRAIINDTRDLIDGVPDFCVKTKTGIMAAVFQRGSFYFSLTATSSSPEKFKQSMWIVVDPHKYHLAEQFVPACVRNVNRKSKSSDALKCPKDATPFICMSQINEMAGAGEKVFMSIMTIISMDIDDQFVIEKLKKFCNKNKDGFRVTINWYLTDLYLVKENFIAFKQAVGCIALEIFGDYVTVLTSHGTFMRYSTVYETFISPHEYVVMWPNAFADQNIAADGSSLTQSVGNVFEIIPPPKAVVALTTTRGSATEHTNEMASKYFSKSVGYTTTTIFNVRNKNKARRVGGLNIPIGEMMNVQDEPLVGHEPKTYRSQRITDEKVHFGQGEANTYFLNLGVIDKADATYKPMPENVKLIHEEYSASLKPELKYDPSERRGRCFADIVPKPGKLFEAFDLILEMHLTPKIQLMSSSDGNPEFDFNTNVHKTYTFWLNNKRKQFKGAKFYVHPAVNKICKFNPNYIPTPGMLMWVTIAEPNGLTVEDGVVCDEALYGEIKNACFINLTLKITFKPGSVDRDVKYVKVNAIEGNTIIFGLLITNSELDLRIVTMNVLKYKIANKFYYTISFRRPPSMGKDTVAINSKLHNNQVLINLHFIDNELHGKKLTTNGLKNVVAQVVKLPERGWLPDGTMIKPLIAYPETGITGRTATAFTMSMINSGYFAITESGGIIGAIRIFNNNANASIKMRLNDIRLPKIDLMTVENGFLQNNVIATLELLNPSSKKNTTPMSDMLALFKFIGINIDPHKHSVEIFKSYAGEEIEEELDPDDECEEEIDLDEDDEVEENSNSEDEGVEEELVENMECVDESENNDEDENDGDNYVEDD